MYLSRRVAELRATTRPAFLQRRVRNRKRLPTSRLRLRVAHAKSQRKESDTLKRFLLLLLVGVSVTTQFGCVPLAAGVAGAAVGHEIADEADEDDGDRN